MRVGLCLLFLFNLLLFHPEDNAGDEAARQIMRRAVERFDVDAIYAEFTMKVIRPGWESDMRFKVWTNTEEYALVLITDPPRERGQAFLKRGDDLWHWIPSIDKTIKMSAALLSQPWMGSDFSLNELIRNSSMANDYAHFDLGSDTLNGIYCHVLELRPNQTAPVVWESIRMWIDVDHFDQLQLGYYDHSGQMAQLLQASGFQKFGDRRMPSRMEMTPMNKSGSKTIIEIETYQFNPILEPGFFSLQNMRRLR